MDLEQCLGQSVSRLRSFPFNNMTQINHAVILPILQALNWDITDPELVRPKYSIDGFTLDYVLFDRENPLILIKTYQLSEDSRDNQIPRIMPTKNFIFLIFTDGKRWDFYFNNGEGKLSDNLFCRLILEENNLPEQVKSFSHFLERSNVLSGRSRKLAEQNKSSLERNIKIDALGRAYNLLVEEPDEMLRDLLIEKVGTEFNFTPEKQLTEEFIKNLRLFAAHDAMIEMKKSAIESSPSSINKGGWSKQGVTLPGGTELQMDYNGQFYKGFIENGYWVVEGRKFKSPSDATKVARTKKGTIPSLNGWRLWCVRLPGDDNWKPLQSFRNLDNTPTRRKRAKTPNTIRTGLRINLGN